MTMAKCGKALCERKELLVLVGAPRHPGDRAVDVVGIGVPVLRAPAFVTVDKHRHALGELCRCEMCALHPASQLEDGAVVVSLAVRPALPGVLPRVVVGHGVSGGQAVVTGGIVDRCRRKLSD